MVNDADFGSLLENIYYEIPDENIMAQFNIDSKYYEVDDIIGTNGDRYDYKYKVLHLNIQGLMSSLEGLTLLLKKIRN